jgi:predicted RNase H-like HicB family nuclease
MYKITLEIEHLPEGPYLGTSPELPGLVVQADSVHEVLRLAPDLAHDLIAVMVETYEFLEEQ